jgi:hypothetical protein
VRLFSKSFLFPVFIFVVFSCTVFADISLIETSSRVEYEYSKENILGFIKHLISQKEYYRASVELKRLESYYPDYIKKDNHYATELFLLFKGRQFPEILGKEFYCDNPNTRAIHNIFAADSLIENSEFIKAKSFIELSGYSGYSKDLNFYLYKRTMLSYLLLNMIDDARKLSEDTIFYFDSGKQDFNFGKLAEYSSDFHNTYKMTYKALTLGAIPGMGYVYAGQKATGIIAFLLVSALSTLTYYSFKNDNKPIGVFAGAAATFFYGGSIAGGYLSTIRYNDSVTEDMKNSLSEKLFIEDDRTQILNQYGVGSAGK